MEQKDYRKMLLSPENSFEIIRKYASLYFSDNLYKFSNFESEFWEALMFKGQIFMARAGEFNDPFDCLVYLDIDKLFSSTNFINQIKSTSPALLLNNIDFKKLDKARYQERIMQDYQQDIRLTCFSEDWKSILMWSHYANCHKGFCIEYSMNKISD